MVPKKGLEPPHRCRYMDLNHARLPIPPLRHFVRLAVALNPQGWGVAKHAVRGDVLLYSTGCGAGVKPRTLKQLPVAGEEF